MNSIRSVRCGALALLLTAAGVGASRADEQVLRFNDPTTPGKIVVQMGGGDVSVVAADGAEVTVTSSEELTDESKPREDGLRRLNSTGNYGIFHEGNTIRIVSNAMLGGNRRFGSGAPNDISLTVPRQTSVTVEHVGSGDTRLEGLAGDVEIKAMSGDVTLVDITGGAAIETMNGDVDATFDRLPDGRPVSISTAHGDVELRVPADAKATVHFRTLRGEMLTNFSVDQLKTLTENIVAADDSLEIDVQVNVEIERERVREEARRVKEEAREVQRQARLAQVEAQRASPATGGMMVPPAPPVPPMPPMPRMPAMPAMAGGQLIASELNGGGTNITVTTLMGDIIFRKVE